MPAAVRRLTYRMGARGVTLGVTLAALVAAGWALGTITQDVIVGEDSARLDRPVLEWFVAHRSPWLTSTMNIVTEFGSPPR